MTQTAIAAEIHQPLDIHGYFTAQVTLNRHITQQTAKLVKLALTQVTNLGLVADSRCIQQSSGLGATTAGCNGNQLPDQDW